MKKYLVRAKNKDSLFIISFDGIDFKFLYEGDSVKITQDFFILIKEVNDELADLYTMGYDR